MKSFSILVFISAFVISIVTGCSNKNDVNLSISDQEKADLLYMFEEEKLARDTYEYLDGLWSVNQFTYIKQSEQSHMNALANLLNKYSISYSTLPLGEFSNQHLQDLYDQFETNGQSDLVSALKIGATIEDLDIVDLQDRMDATTNTSIISVYQSLQCGSRNHLRSFVSAVVNQSGSYEPQFLTVPEFNTIINGSNEQCN